MSQSRRPTQTVHVVSILEVTILLGLNAFHESEVSGAGLLYPPADEFVPDEDADLDYWAQVRFAQRLSGGLKIQSDMNDRKEREKDEHEPMTRLLLIRLGYSLLEGEQYIPICAEHHQ